MLTNERIQELKTKFAKNNDVSQLLEEYEAITNRTQVFFETLASEIRKPSFGDMAKGVFQDLLMRAEVAGIYLPQVTHE
jgi:hypothetical protein